MSASTVDEGVLERARLKLQLDAAVLEGVTSTGIGAARKGGGNGAAADAMQACARQPAISSVPLLHACPCLSMMRCPAYKPVTASAVSVAEVEWITAVQMGELLQALIAGKAQQAKEQAPDTEQKRNEATYCGADASWISRLVIRVFPRWCYTRTRVATPHSSRSTGLL